MEFHDKLQELRKQKGMTQEQLATALYVSRTAISKWESGRGYPSIDSLKAISAFFGVSIDDLLSGSELLTIAAEDQKQAGKHLSDLVYACLDLSTLLFFFLPLFGVRSGDAADAFPLLTLNGISAYLIVAFFIIVILLALTGTAALILQNLRHPIWLKTKRALSLSLTAAGALLFIVAMQPYAAAFLFAHLLIKAFLLYQHR